MYTKLCYCGSEKRGILQLAASETNLKHVVFICLFCLLCITRRMFKVKPDAGHRPGFPSLSVVGLLEDARVHSSPLHAFSTQSDHRRMPPLIPVRCPELRGYRTMGLTTSSLFRQQEHGICDPERGKWKQGLHHIPLLAISDNCHNCKQASRVLAVYHYLLLTILQTPASQNKGSLGPSAHLDIMRNEGSESKPISFTLQDRSFFLFSPW